MAIPITVPRLGWTMEEGVFVGWLKPDGAAVSTGEPLFTLESEKATQDIESLENGILRIAPDAPRAGDRVAVGAVIGHLTEAGEAVPSLSAASGKVARPPEQPVPASAQNAVSSRKQHALPISSPRARRVAAELQIDWTGLAGSGRGGRIRERDVRAAAVSSQDKADPHRSLRNTISQRMVASHQTTAPVTLTTTADATNLVNLRKQFKAAREAGADVVPGYTDFLVKLTAVALQKHPLLNAGWIDDRIQQSPGIHVGVAVDTEAGLLVPVLRDVPSLGLKQIAARLHDLVERARVRKLMADELQGGTFTITNLGALGIDTFTPIINLPQCAIIGVGRIGRRPVVVGDEIAIREQITLSLTFDHRMVDGAPAARFLQTLSALIENPGPWMMT
jgi:pyruvate dehydrogenase E2 component (dihydrolipoamide acetyltransferase)